MNYCFARILKSSLIAIHRSEIKSNFKKALQSTQGKIYNRLFISPQIIYHIKLKTSEHPAYVAINGGLVSIAEIVAREVKNKKTCLTECPFGKQRVFANSNFKSKTQEEILLHKSKMKCPKEIITGSRCVYFKIPIVGDNKIADCFIFPGYKPNNCRLCCPPIFFHSSAHPDNQPTWIENIS